MRRALDGATVIISRPGAVARMTFLPGCTQLDVDLRRRHRHQRRQHRCREINFSFPRETRENACAIPGNSEQT